VALGFWVGATVRIADGALVAVGGGGAVLVGATVAVYVGGGAAVGGDAVGGGDVGAGGTVGGKAVGCAAGCDCVVAIGAGVLGAAGLLAHAASSRIIASMIVKSVVFRRDRDFIVTPPFESITITFAIISHWEKRGIIRLAHLKEEASGWCAPQQPHQEKHPP
jgi:hypothetical protein